MKNPGNRQKYNNEKVDEDGYKFDSDLERRFYLFLKEEKAAGKIKGFELQPQFELQPKYSKYGRNIMACNYRLDFEILHLSGSRLLIDVKGQATEKAKLQRKLFDFKYPDKKLQWMSYSKIDGGWIDYDELKKRRKERKKAREAKKK